MQHAQTTEEELENIRRYLVFSKLWWVNYLSDSKVGNQRHEKVPELNPLQNT